MTLVVDVLARAARQCSVKEPSSWLTASQPEYKELRDDYLLETVDDILDRFDLPQPFSHQWSPVTDGSETYNLPSDMKRLMRDPLAVYEAGLQRPVRPISSDGEWVHLQQTGSAGAERFYRVHGREGRNTIQFYGPPEAGVEIIIQYMSRNWMQGLDGVGAENFTLETDVIRLPRRPVELGIVWRYRRRRGIFYADVQAEQEMLLTRFGNDSRGRRSTDMTGNSAVRRPWDVPVPGYIPSS